MASILNFNFPKARCSICQQDAQQYLVYHTKGGRSHPFHSACLKDALFFKNHCPNCHIKINDKSFLSFKDRAIRILYVSTRESIAAAKLANLVTVALGSLAFGEFLTEIPTDSLEEVEILARFAKVASLATMGEVFYRLFPMIQRIYQECIGSLSNEALAGACMGGPLGSFVFTNFIVNPEDEVMDKLVVIALSFIYSAGFTAGYTSCIGRFVEEVFA